MTLIPSADISTLEASTVTQNLNLDQMFERSIRTLKDTNITVDTHFLFHILLLFFASYDPLWMILILICILKWRQNVPGISDRILGYYPILISSQHLKTYHIWSSLQWNVWRRLLTAVRCKWWNRATGFTIPCSGIDPLPAFVSSGYPDDFLNFLHFFFLIKKI